MIDRDRAVRIGGGEDAALAVDEHRLDDVQVALLDADAGAVAVGDVHMGEDQPLDPRRAPAQHQGRLVLANAAVEDRRPRRGGDIGDAARLLDGTIVVAAGAIRIVPWPPPIAPTASCRLAKDWPVSAIVNGPEVWARSPPPISVAARRMAGTGSRASLRIIPTP